jgi:hypothetical protein
MTGCSALRRRISASERRMMPWHWERAPIDSGLDPEAVVIELGIIHGSFGESGV